MNDNIEIRESRPTDANAIEKLYPDAFPDEELLPLVRELLAEASGVVSLVAMAGDALAGHIVFTDCGIAGNTLKAALLGPLAVATARQRQGIGSALVRAGLGLLEDAGIGIVLVLGDPAYYGRLGFRPDDAVAPPYPLPKEWRGAWQSLTLNGQAAPQNGELIVPPPWRHKELWAP